MAYIVPDILSLSQYLSENFKINNCLNCGKAGPWKHGHYHRKADHENHHPSSLNPIKILRFYCVSCKHTFSVLPECIPPRRWHLWAIQQAALFLFLNGYSFKKISQQLCPSRWSIRRWITRFKEQFSIHAFYLKNRWTWLGYDPDFEDFWTHFLSKKRLSEAMVFLNNQAVAIP